MARAAMLHDEQPSLLARIKEETLRDSNPKLSTNYKTADGAVQHVPLHAHFKEAYRDEYTGETLPSTLQAGSTLVLQPLREMCE